MFRRRRPTGSTVATRRRDDIPLVPEESWDGRLAARLERLHGAISARDDPSLWTLLTAADEIADEWLASCDRLVAARAEAAAAADDEAAINARLRSLMALIEATVGGRGDAVVASTEASAPDPDRTAPVEPSPDATAPPGSGTGRSARPTAAPLPPPAGVEPGPEGDPSGPHRRPTAGDLDADLHGEHRELHLGPDVGDNVAGHPGAPPAHPSGIRAATGAPAAAPNDGLAIFLLGRVRIALDGDPVDLCVHGKALRLFRYLLAHRDQAIPKDVLIELLWPDADLDTGRRGLHQAVYTIRRSLRGADPDGHLIVFEDDAYRINPAIPTWCDVEEFERCVAHARVADARGDHEEATTLLRRADDLAAGDFAEDAPYEDWAITERERLRLMYVRAIKRLGELSEAAGDLQGAIEASRRVLAVEPCDEACHRRIMHAHAQAGNRHLAIRQYHLCVDALDRGYGLEPSVETTELYESLMDPSYASA